VRDRAGRGCIPELAVPGTGRLLRGNVTADALASAMLEVVTNPAEAQRIGAAAAQRAVHQFDDAVMARAYETLYREITPSGREPISRSRAAS
jgi:glycosyltransferase involved in cell wall biosynthesis